jgi:hypothetical protein
MLKTIARLFSRFCSGFWSNLWIAVLLSLIGTTSHADLVLQPFTATYQMSIKGLTTTATRTLIKNTDGTWLLRDNAAYLFFKIDEQSIFRIEKNNLVPQQYGYEQGSERDYHLRFDWNKNYAFSNYKKKDIRYGLTPGAIDRLTLQLQLQLELKDNRGPDEKGRDYAVADEKDLKTYRITLIGKESITLNGKKIEAIHLQQQRPGKQRINHLWLDPARNYQMVKFEQWEKGVKTSEMVLIDSKS